LIRRVLRPLVAAMILACGTAAAHADAPGDPPALTRLDIKNDVVRAATDPDSIGRALWVTWDRKANRWSEPVAQPAPVLTRADSLAAVRVFDGGLFDKFGGTELLLEDGTVLAKSDTGFALSMGTESLGWPPVTPEDVDEAGGKIRQGLPRDFPEDRLYQLLGQHRLLNEPGPTVRAGDIRWFGLKGGFTAGVGQIGGLLSYDFTKKQWNVERPFLLVDASVTRVYARNGEVWIGTARFGESAIEGITGLILYRPSRGEWRQFSRRNSRISGDLVWDIAEDSNALWVTTDRGISRYGFDSKNWSSWYWHPAKAGAWTLTSKPPGDLVEELVK
jgi:hypothetical protein